MATEQGPSTVTAPVAAPQIQRLQTWLVRLGLSGKILAIGGLVGGISLPAACPNSLDISSFPRSCWQHDSLRCLHGPADLPWMQPTRS